MPFPTLISALSMVLSARDIALISKFYEDKRVSAFSCLNLFESVFECVLCLFFSSWVASSCRRRRFHDMNLYKE